MSGRRSASTTATGIAPAPLDPRLGPLELGSPKLRQGSYFPIFLEPRKTSEQALVAVIQEAWIGGVSTRRVDDLVQAMGLTGISKLVLGRARADPGEPGLQTLQGHRRAGDGVPGAPLEGAGLYLWLDATYLRQREGGRIVTVAVIIAVAVSTDGRREIIGLHVGPSHAGLWGPRTPQEAETFWSWFLKKLVKRGLKGVRLVVSDAHEGLKHAIGRGLASTWQRCRVPLWGGGARSPA